jgi:hypothetical protein
MQHTSLRNLDAKEKAAKKATKNYKTSLRDCGLLGGTLSEKASPTRWK